MARRRRQEGDAVDVNLTPMIDVTFQLIIFFILTAQIASEELAKLKTHKPYNSQATAEEDVQDMPNKVIVNVVNRYGDKDKQRDPYLASQPEYYQVGITRVEVGDVETLSNLMKNRKASAKAKGYKEFFVEIRADKDIAYGSMEPVMRAAADAKIKKMSITAIVAAPSETQ
jgi:biopolymer transport protein ExbD